MIRLTKEQRAEIARLRFAMLKIAMPVGPQHGFHYFIADLDRVLEGNRTMLNWTPDRLIQECRIALREL